MIYFYYLQKILKIFYKKVFTNTLKCDNINNVNNNHYFLGGKNMKMITGLTKANIKNTGIELSPEHDFTDDGNRFRGFIYKGMPMTQCRSEGTCYLAIRVDYLRNNFTFKEWMKTEEYKLEDEFNGVSQFDLDKLIENLEKIITKVDEMNAAAKAEELNMDLVKEALENEIKYAESVIAEFKTNFKWYEANEYNLKNLVRYLKDEEKEIANAKKMLNEIDELEIRRQKEMIESLNEYHYVKIKSDSFYLREMKEALAK